jgi:DNA-binding transcriptional LysR family regulator
MLLNETLAFVAVVRAGSFTAAGRRMGVPKSTLSKQVTRLEERLGARLLQRTTRRLSLTETGEAYFSRCRQAIEDIEEAERVAADVSGRVTGTLRVGGTEEMGHSWFGPLMPEFRERYPELKVTFVLTSAKQDLVADNIDVSVRGAPALDEGLIARKLASDNFRFYAAPSYVARRGAPQTPDDLAAHEVLGHTFMSTMELPLVGPDGPAPTRVSPWLTSNEFSTTRAAVVAGGGVGVLLEAPCLPSVERGELVQVLDDWHLPGGNAWAIYPSKHHLSPKVRVFVDFLVESIERNSGVLPFVG